MQLPGRRDEEGQVTPALLIAVIGGFALAVAFVSLQNLLDQSGRAATASDAAALAAGAGHRDAFEDVFAGNSGLHLGLLRQMLEEGSLQPAIIARAEQEAREYADANGAEVRTVTYDGFDLGQRQWEYTVLTQQRDTVEGGTTTARSESRSRVAVRVTAGMCGGGLVVGGDCRPWGLLEQLCDLELLGKTGLLLLQSFDPGGQARDLVLGVRKRRRRLRADLDGTCELRVQIAVGARSLAGLAELLFHGLVLHKNGGHPRLQHPDPHPLRARIKPRVLLQPEFLRSHQ